MVINTFLGDIPIVMRFVADVIGRIADPRRGVMLAPSLHLGVVVAGDQDQRPVIMLLPEGRYHAVGFI